ncbi:MAG: NTP transferase domain-containing protein, partial [Nitrososphaerales archaeon]
MLAAGLSTRFGGVKQLAKFRGKPLVQNALESANRSEAEYTYLVLG